MRSGCFAATRVAGPARRKCAANVDDASDVSPVSMPELQGFGQRIGEIAARLAKPGFIACTDLTGANILPPDVAEWFIRLMQRDNPVLERGAFLTGSSAVFALQLERMFKQSSSHTRRTFREPGPLLAWLGELATPAERDTPCPSETVFLRPDGADEPADLLVPPDTYALKILSTMGFVRATAPEFRGAVEPWLERVIAARSGEPGLFVPRAQSLLDGIRSGRDDTATAYLLDRVRGLALLLRRQPRLDR